MPRCRGPGGDGEDRKPPVRGAVVDNSQPWPIELPQKLLRVLGRWLARPSNPQRGGRPAAPGTYRLGRADVLIRRPSRTTLPGDLASMQQVVLTSDGFRGRHGHKRHIAGAYWPSETRADGAFGSNSARRSPRLFLAACQGVDAMVHTAKAFVVCRQHQRVVRRLPFELVQRIEPVTLGSASDS